MTLCGRFERNPRFDLWCSAGHVPLSHAGMSRLEDPFLSCTENRSDLRGNQLCFGAGHSVLCPRGPPASLPAWGLNAHLLPQQPGAERRVGAAGISQAWVHCQSPLPCQRHLSFLIMPGRLGACFWKYLHVAMWANLSSDALLGTVGSQRQRSKASSESNDRRKMF